MQLARARPSSLLLFKLLILQAAAGCCSKQKEPLASFFAILNQHHVFKE